jgi:hypothetical protein
MDRDVPSPNQWIMFTGSEIFICCAEEEMDEKDFGDTKGCRERGLCSQISFFSQICCSKKLLDSTKHYSKVARRY